MRRFEKLLVGALLFSVFGLMTEILFTGFSAGSKADFMGQVSVLMIPVYTFSYTLAFFFFDKVEKILFHRWTTRIPTLILIIYCIEWSSGALYKFLGFQPWHYDHGWASDFSGGNITLLYLPAWAIFAAILPSALRAIGMMSPIIIDEFFAREIK